MPETDFRALLATQTDGPTTRVVASLPLDTLDSEGVLVDVAFSSVNYKDGLATTAEGRVARVSPLIPGIDLAGTVIADGTEAFPVGTAVLAHGYDLGVAHHGGFAERARVPAEWLVALPEGLSARDAMVIGTAGFTAALSVVALEDWGLVPSDGPILVTGATGGVGSVAVNLLAKKGFEVLASTGKPAEADFLRVLGASEVLDRAALAEPGKPLQKELYAGAIDCVGGTTLASVLAQLRYGGAVAASGLTGGASLATTVMPFILRGVALLGIDSVQTPIERRRAIWGRLGGDLRPSALAELGRDIALDALDATLEAILAGQAVGRTVVDLHL